MQSRSSLSPPSSGLTLAHLRKQRQSPLSTSAVGDFQGPFGATLLQWVAYILQIFFCHWFLKILHRNFCSVLSNRKIEENGVMGGHTRRSKQSVKESSTVICDSSGSIEDWKQQIKVKDSIPLNQQRLTFTSQRSAKQNFALTKLIPDRQWQILVDANIEDICKDLKGWRATLRSKNISADLLQPLVLKETDNLASFLLSKTANDLRQIGVPCRVFFLSFKEWIPRLQTKESSPSTGELRGLDIKVDEEFRGNIFFIDLHGDFNGFPIPIPLQYVMNGSQLAAKLFMVEQTAQYREDQRQRHQRCLAPASEDSNTENSERSLAVNCQSSCNDYVLEIQQNCELTAFVSRENHRLRCIVLPVITIPLVETKGGEHGPHAYLSREELNEGQGEQASNVLALPSASEIVETLATSAAGIVEGENLGHTPAIPTRKNTKKKRKKRSKKPVKENIESCTHSEHGETQDAVSCQNPEVEVSQEKASWHAVYGLNAAISTDSEKNAEDARPLISNKLEMCCVMPVEDIKGIALPEVENKAISSKCSTFGPQIHEQQTYSCSAATGAALLTTQEPDDKQTMDCMADHGGPEIHMKRDVRPSVGTCIYNGATKPDNASTDNELSLTCTLKIDFPKQYDSSNTLDPSSAPECKSDTSGSPKAEGDANLKGSAHGKFQPERSSALHTDAIEYSNTTCSNFQSQRGDQSSGHIRMNHVTQRAVEGQNHLPYRRKANQHIHAGFVSDDSRSSAPFWRHQREGVPIPAHSWSKAKASRTDDGGRFFSASYARNPRNMPAWEQMPNLRQASNGSSFPISCENRASMDSPWSLSRGHSYSSFNMQQRKSGKSNKIPNRFSDRWQPQCILNDQMALTPKLLNLSSDTANLQSNEKSECTGTFSKNLDAEQTRNQESWSKEALEPCIGQRAANTLFWSQDFQRLSEVDKFSLQGPGSALAEHLHEILYAVNASYEAWVLYEQVLSGNGKSTCEFERVAQAVAPTIGVSTSKQHWQHVGCLCDVLPKQIPGLQLSDFWHWYEEPSSYGVKVKLTESSKRTGNNYQAFFVPYLSAIQLFGYLGKRQVANNKETAPSHCGRLIEADSSNQPILSILLPKPKGSNDLLIRDESFKETKAGHDMVCSEKLNSDTLSTIKKRCHCDVELLYEFFEQEKPQQRKPLTDRINELVSRPELSGSGNARLLCDAKIQDLHPSSWFAVAWYPIYKIPDETFRSAFLTYHCVSCLQSMRLESENYVDTRMHSITAPVVGMMSYNAQIKEWFSLSPSSEVRPNDVLQEYLAKLESAATSMARGSSENSSSTFKHADFNFFQSRGR